jgi:hypothetical protein
MQKQDYILTQPVYRVYTTLQIMNNISATQRRQEIAIKNAKK